MGFPDSSVGKESVYNAGDHGSILGPGRSPGEGIGYTLQYSWASLVAQLVKNLPAMWDTWVWSLRWEDPWRRKRLPTPVFLPGDFHGLYIVHGVTKSNFHTSHKHTFKICSSCNRHSKPDAIQEVYNRLVPNRKRSTSRLYIVTLLI